MAKYKKHRYTPYDLRNMISYDTLNNNKFYTGKKIKQVIADLLSNGAENKYNYLWNDIKLFDARYIHCEYPLSDRGVYKIVWRRYLEHDVALKCIRLRN